KAPSWLSNRGGQHRQQDGIAQGSCRKKIPIAAGLGRRTGQDGAGIQGPKHGAILKRPRPAEAKAGGTEAKPKNDRPGVNIPTTTNSMRQLADGPEIENSADQAPLHAIEQFPGELGTPPGEKKNRQGGARTPPPITLRTVSQRGLPQKTAGRIDETRPEKVLL